MYEIYIALKRTSYRTCINLRKSIYKNNIIDIVKKYQHINYYILDIFVKMPGLGVDNELNTKMYK